MNNHDYELERYFRDENFVQYNDYEDIESIHSACEELAYIEACELEIN